VILHGALFRPGAKPSQFIEVIPADQLATQNAASNTSGTEEVTTVSAPIVKPTVATSQRRYYQVKAGDTLTRIAAKYNTTVAVLCKLNGISPSGTLVIGKNLRVK